MIATVGMCGTGAHTGNAVWREIGTHSGTDEYAGTVTTGGDYLGDYCITYLSSDPEQLEVVKRVHIHQQMDRWPINLSSPVHIPPVHARRKLMFTKSGRLPARIRKKRCNA